MKIVIPARGGSRRIRRKNLQLLVGGKTLLQYAIERASTFGEVVVSTEDPEIASIARMFGVQVHDRPADAADGATTVDEVMERFFLTDQEVMCWQPTVVGYTDDDIAALISAGRERRVSVSLALEAPHITWVDTPPRIEKLVRQEVGIRYYPPGEAYGRPLGVYTVTSPIIDIDTPDDLEAARRMMNRLDIAMLALGDTSKGTGHIYNTVALANELQHHSVSIALLDPTQQGIELLGSLGWGPPTLWTPAHRRLDIAIYDTLDLIEDNPHSSHTKVVQIETTRPWRNTDLIVNAMYPTGHPREVAGGRYAVLRPEFLIPKEVHEPVTGDERVLVTFGGSDPAHLTEMVYPYLSHFQCRVLAPPGRPVATMDWPVVTGSVAEHLHWADVVVTSGGRTVFEAQATGTPAVVLAQNPRELTHRHLGPEHGVINLGIGRLVEPRHVGRVVAEALRPTTWRELVAATKGQVDGLGATRVARLIERLVEP